MNDIRHGWKILTHDGRSPLQGGPSLLTGHFPVRLPPVALDTSEDECAAGWNYTADIATGWRIAGLWSTGYPSRVVAVEAAVDALQRKDKRRASSLTLVREATPHELTTAMEVFSRGFAPHMTGMAREQLAWLDALARPRRDAAEVEAQLALALSARCLPWTLKRYDSARAAGAAWAAWDAWDAWAAWDAWDAWDAWAAWAAGAAWDAGDAWAAGDAWDAGDAGAAGDAWDALMVFYARLMKWQMGEPDQYTVGIREAYRHGLAVAIPVGPTTLGWAMEP